MLRLLRNGANLWRMAIEFARTNVISRSAGQSAVRAAAYRSGTSLFDERTGRTANYAFRSQEVGHSEVLLPKGADPALADRVRLWSAVENREDQHNRRASAQLALDHIIALPSELSRSQHVDIARAFAQADFVSKGLVVDLAIHYHSDGNPHAHLMTTTRPLEGATFGAKSRGGSGQFYAGSRIPEKEQIRHRWADFQNRYFLENHIEAHVRNNDGEFVAQVHLGPTHAMEERGIVTAVQEENNARIAARDEAILNHPEIIIERVSDRKSLFSRHDLYREMSTLIVSAEVFAQVKAVIDSHPSLIQVTVEDREMLTTQKVLDTEIKIRLLGYRMSRHSADFSVDESLLEGAFSRYDFLSEEQRDAARHLTSETRLSMVVGLAGAGKSTMLTTVREAYEASGHRVAGIALAGKAAEELQGSAGIESRTIAGWLLAVEQERECVERGDVLVMDEAGMVNNHTAQKVLDIVDRAGAKLIMVGDGEQLQPIQAGCPFRDLSNQHGYAEIGTIRRQKEQWQRDATKALSRGDGHAGLEAYARRGHVQSYRSLEETKQRLVKDFLEDTTESRIILAHRNKDVDDINEQIRQSLVDQGMVDAGMVFRATKAGSPENGLSIPFDLRGGDRIRFGDDHDPLRIQAGVKGTYLALEEGRHHVRLDDGREYRLSSDDYGSIQHAESDKSKELIAGRGDRVLFTRNDKTLGPHGVKNGSLGTVLSHEDGVMQVQIDNQAEPVSFSYNEYSDVKLGYATTVHKSQGMTVDRSFVLGNGTMNKHLGYVAMSRHREAMDVYVATETLRGKSFSTVISQADRQETVLDLADRHGLELNPEAVDPMSFSNRSGDRHQEEAMRSNMMASIKAKLMENPTLSEATDAVQAQRDIDSATRELLNEMESRHRADCAALEKASEDRRKALEVQARTEPKPGLFTSKKVLERWQKERKQLEIEHINAARALARSREDFASRFEHREWEAKEQARQMYPKQAGLVERHADLKQAQRLIRRWERIEKELAGAIRTSVSSTASRTLTESLVKTLREIERSQAIQSVLTPDQRQAFSQSRLDTAKAMDRARIHDRGLDS